MYNMVLRENPCALKFVPDPYKTQEMREKALEEKWWILRVVSDQYMTQEMCERAVESGY